MKVSRNISHGSPALGHCLQGEQVQGQSPFLPHELEFVAGDEGYISEPDTDIPDHQRPRPGREGDQPDQRRHRQPLPVQARFNKRVAPQFRQHMWKLVSKRAEMRKAVRKVARPL